MSIYASLEVPNDDPDGDAPLVYQGSHVLPSEADPRGGHVDLALIPSHITRDGRDDQPEDGAPWPYLRFGVNESTVVLTRSQVEQISVQLEWWLAGTAFENHRGDFRERVECAREALLGDDEAMLRYLRGDRG